MHNPYSDPATSMLRQMVQARQFNQWMADTVSPFIHGHVLEIGAGIGTMTKLLSGLAALYVASETDADLLRELRAGLGDSPNVRTAVCDATHPTDFQKLGSGFDTVVCLNVLEHIEDDTRALQNIHGCLRPGGSAVLLVPQGSAAFGTLDRILGHHRRYSEAELRRKMTAAGFTLDKLLRFNRATYPGWILNSRLLKRRTLSAFQLTLFDFLVPLWRIVDAFLPWPPTSLIGIGVKRRHDTP